MRHLLRRNSVAGPVAWMGSLPQDAQDASGLMYRRNRFYDPRSGRFTQEDPIGLAGGVNAYGFAEGDAVSYADPFGLTSKAKEECPYDPCESDDTNARKITAEADQAEHATGRDVAVVTITASGLAVGGLVIGEGLMAVGGGDMLLLRGEYEAAVHELRGVGEHLLAEGRSEEYVARTLSSARRTIGEIYKTKMPISLRMVVYGRNLVAYGDRLGPTIGWLLARGKTWADIIDSAARPGGADLIPCIR